MIPISWISSERLNKMGNRILKESITTSEEIDKLTWFEEVLFYRIIIKADDYGILDARPKILKSYCFPLKEGVTVKDIEKGLSRLSTVGLVRVYEDKRGRPFLRLCTWGEHQRLRNSKHRYPEEEALNEDSPQVAASCGKLPPESEFEYEFEIEEEKEKRKREKSSRFSPPTLEEVSKYCLERGNNVDPKRFFDFYAAGHWKDSKGEPVRNWKQRVISWEKDDNKITKSSTEASSMPVYDATNNPNTSKEQIEEFMSYYAEGGKL